MTKLRAYTEEEIIEMLMSKIYHSCQYWANETLETTEIDRLEGLVHTILSTLDGSSLELPSFDLIACPHKEDKEWYKENGENWFNKTRIHTSLHDEYYAYKKKHGLE